MKTIQIKPFDGKWYQGEIRIRYNLLTVAKVLILAAALALVAAIIYLLYQGACWLWDAVLLPVIAWIGENWLWLLLSLLGIAAVVWAWLKGLFRNLFRRRSENQQSKRNWWWMLLALLALLLGLLCWRSCSGDEREKAEETVYTVYDLSFDKVIIARAYLDGVQETVNDACPRALVGFKFIDDKSVKDYNFTGLTYEESVKIVANDWKPLVVENLNPELQLSEQQMAVLTLAAMRMGKYGFARSTFLQKVNEGNFAEATNWLLLQKANGEIRKTTRDEPKQYFFMLRALWENKISIEELLDMPMFSYKAIPVQTMYNKDGSFVWNEAIKEALKSGNFATPRTALGLE